VPSSHIKAQLQGATLVLLSGVTLSTKAILAKLAYRHGVDALTMLSLRMFFAVPLLLLSVYFAEKSSATRLTRKDLLQIALLGVTGYYISAMLDFLGLSEEEQLRQQELRTILPGRDPKRVGG
jgi:drug/metabolite transporter (DMT)-like permease